MAHATQCKSQQRFSLVGIDKPHKTKLLVQSALQGSIASHLFSSPLLSYPRLSSSHLASLARAVHISNQHDRQWKLFISGSGLMADCLSIHTNKGQRSHDEADKASLTHAHKHTHFCTCSCVQTYNSTFQKASFFWIPDLWSSLGSQNTSKQISLMAPYSNSRQNARTKMIDLRQAARCSAMNH